MSPPPSPLCFPLGTTARFKKGPSDEEGCGSSPLGSAPCQNGGLVSGPGTDPSGPLTSPVVPVTGARGRGTSVEENLPLAASSGV